MFLYNFVMIQGTPNTIRYINNLLLKKNNGKEIKKVKARKLCFERVRF